MKWFCFAQRICSWQFTLFGLRWMSNAIIYIHVIGYSIVKQNGETNKIIGNTKSSGRCWHNINTLKWSVAGGVIPNQSVKKQKWWKVKQNHTSDLFSYSPCEELYSNWSTVSTFTQQLFFIKSLTECVCTHTSGESKITVFT